MAIRSQENAIGAWSFFIGVILAIVIGVFQSQLGVQVNWIYIVLVILGIIVGLSNTADRDVDKFLIASVALVIVSYMGQDTLRFLSKIGLIISTVLSALLLMFVPAAIIVAVKAVFSITKT
jgi:hypothetical protein